MARAWKSVPTLVATMFLGHAHNRDPAVVDIDGAGVAVWRGISDSGNSMTVASLFARCSKRSCYIGSVCLSSVCSTEVTHLDARRGSKTHKHERDRAGTGPMPSWEAPQPRRRALHKKTTTSHSSCKTTSGATCLETMTCRGTRWWCAPSFWGSMASYTGRPAAMRPNLTAKFGPHGHTARCRRHQKHGKVASQVQQFLLCCRPIAPRIACDLERQPLASPQPSSIVPAKLPS